MTTSKGSPDVGPAIAPAVIGVVHEALKQLGVSDTSGDPDEVIERAAESLGEPMLGVVVASQIPVGAYGILEYGMRASATVGDAMERLCRFYGTVSTRARLEVGVLAGRHALICRRREGVRYNRHWIEMAGAAIAGRLANAAGDAPLVAEVWFAHAAPNEGVVPRYERAFDAAVRFDQSVDALLFHEGALERSMWTSSPSLASSADTIMRTLEPEGSAFSEPLRARLRAAILNGLTTGVTLAGVARELNMSPRTLQRSLRERGSSWSEDLDDVRRERALVLIEDESRKMADIAVELGFGDTSAFFRAFRRWTGTTPRKRRESA